MSSWTVTIDGVAPLSGGLPFCDPNGTYRIPANGVCYVQYVVTTCTISGLVYTVTLYFSAGNDAVFMTVTTPGGSLPGEFYAATTDVVSCKDTVTFTNAGFNGGTITITPNA